MNHPAGVTETAVAIIAFFASKEVASAVGPYAAIAFLGLTGAVMWAANTERKMSILSASGHVFVRMCMAIGLTASAAGLIEHFFPALAPKYTVAILAFVIGYIDDYKALFKNLTSLVAGWVKNGRTN